MTPEVSGFNLSELISPSFFIPSIMAPEDRKKAFVCEIQYHHICHISSAAFIIYFILVYLWRSMCVQFFTSSFIIQPETITRSSLRSVCVYMGNVLDVASHMWWFLFRRFVFILYRIKSVKREGERKVNVLTQAAVKGSALLITTAHMKVLVNNFPCAEKLSKENCFRMFLGGRK